MGFVNKEDDRLGRSLDLVDHGLQAVFKFSLDPGPGLEQTHVQSQDGNPLENLGHIPFHYPEGQPLDHGRLAHARFPDHDRVIFTPPGQDVDHLADFLIAAKNRINLSGPCFFGKIYAETG